METDARERGVNWAKLRDQCLVGVCLLVFLAAGAWLLGHVVRILLLILLAVVLAYALEPALGRLERFLPRAWAALGLYLAVVALLAGLLVLFGHPLATQADALRGEIPTYFDRVTGAVQGVAAGFGIALPGLGSANASSEIARSVQGGAKDILLGALTALTLVATAIVDIVLVLVLAFYFMVDGRRMRSVIVALFPRQQREKVRFVEETINQVLGAYIRGQLTLAAIIGVSAGLGCWLLGVNYPLVIGLLAFCFELVPMAGPILAALPALLIALFQPFPLVLWVLVFFVVMQMAENNVLGPRISGHAVGLHPAAAMIALLVGADVAGIWGALFAVPVVGVGVVLVNAIWKSWRGEPVVLERGPIRLRLPRRRKKARTA
jgi:predicted PurR-regulated permease PerM